MTDCITSTLKFPKLGSRQINATFNGGNVTSDGGILLLRQIDQNLSFTEKCAHALKEIRRVKSCTHKLIDLLRQRVYAIAAGYEDLNDHDELRHDLAFQTAVGRTDVLAGSSTLCRFEHASERETTVKLHEAIVNQFIDSFDEPPEELVLDFDATDDPTHGNQEGSTFHGFYGHYCFLPLYVFCGSQLLVAYLRPSRIDASKHFGPILKLLVKKFRSVWPEVKISIRADSGFCRHRMFGWCELYGIEFIIGQAKNAVLKDRAAALLNKAREQYLETKVKQRIFGDIQYAAGTWKKPRRIIAKAEHTSKGENPRFVVTNMKGDAQKLYDEVYCARGDMENRIKEQQLDLFADRTSCHNWFPNQFRLLLSSMAYILLDALRRGALNGTELAKSYCGTVRLKLLKIGAVITRNTRAIRFMLSSAYPYQNMFCKIVQRLVPD